MTKILSARDLLELVRQQDVEDRAAEEVSESTRGRRIYSINQRTRAPARASVEQRLPMVEVESDDFDLHKTLELQLPTAPTKPKPQVVYDIAPTSPHETTARGAGRDPRSDDFEEPAPSSRRRPPTFQKTLEMQIEDAQLQRPQNRTVEMQAPSPSAPSPSPPSPPVAPKPPVAPVAPLPPVPPVRPTAPQAPVAPVAPVAAAARGPRNTQKLGAVRPEEDPGLAALAAELNASAQTVNRAAETSRSLSPRAFQRVQAPVPVIPRDEPEEGESDDADPASPGRAARRPAVQGWARKMTPSDSPRADTLPEIATDEAFQTALELASAPTKSRKSERPKAQEKTTGWTPGRSKRSSRPPPRAAEPQLEDAEPESLTEPIALTGDETLVLLNYDQTVPLAEVAERTGLTAFRVSTILGQLLDRGVISEVAEDAIGLPAPGRKIPAEQRTYEIEDDFLAKPMPSLEQMAEDADLPSTLADVDLPANVVRDDLPAKVKSAPRGGPNESAGPATTRDALSVEASPDSGNGGGRAPPASGEKLKGSQTKDDDDEIVDDEPPSSTGPEEELDPRSMAAAANFQRHYELNIAHKTTDERAHLAATGTRDDLFALSFDKEPGVIRALWENASLDSEHARFASFHHRTALGLERLYERSDFARDIQVQRRLLRNPLLSEPLLRRLLMPKRLIEIYKVMLDRDVPERTRTSTRGILRTKYANTEPEDRVQLIWNTEGRVLQFLTGLTIDSKCASILCSRAVVSVMLVQSLCKFSATPPSVIHHCLKQPMIRRQLHLRNMLLKHPNCPSEAKRAF